MDSDQGKLFVGGISRETTEEKLMEYFGPYGNVLQTVVMRDKITSMPRGFGFVVFADPNVVDTVLEDTHVIDGRTVEAKRALSREEQQTSRAGNSIYARNNEGGGNTRTNKIFVGGLPPTLTEDGFRHYFEAYGNVTDVVIMYDQQTNRPRGFGFISFNSEDAVDRVLHKTFHDLSGKQVEVKRALPRDASSGPSGRSSIGGGSGSGGNSGAGYQGNGQSGGILNSYDRHMDSNRYMQSQNTRDGYPPYGSTGYSAPGYGYGHTNSGMGYGGYGGYAGASTGYGGPGAGYGSNQPGAPRNLWSSQAPAGCENMGYGNTGGAVGQSPSGTSAYGNQGYGYGGYNGNDRGYGNAAGNGAAGSEPPISNTSAGGAGGYMGGSYYGDTSANAGYGNEGWGSDPSQAYGQPGHAGFGGGYGGDPARQAYQ